MSTNILFSDIKPAQTSPPAQLTNCPSDTLDIVRCEHVLRVVASYFRLPMVDLLSSTRGKRRVAFARQLAMYLAHTHYQLPMSLVARTMGRDRSTVGFGCRRIEDMRDDTRTDTIVSCLELLLANGDLPPPSPIASARDASYNCNHEKLV